MLKQPKKLLVRVFSLLLLLSLICSSCNTKPKKKVSKQTTRQQEIITETSLIVLGTVQDAGSPHIACKKACCKGLFEKANPKRKVVSLGIIDAINKKSYLMEATPDIGKQMKMLKKYSNQDSETPDGIFLTHAHIGHYAGLMYLGKEAMSANEVPVYAMPNMKTYLENNGPWSQLISEKNISLQPLKNEQITQLTDQISLIPFTVPHRDEFSETVGYIIQGPNKKALFIPDIDKWEKWEKDIIEEISKVDMAFVDATFFDGVELNNRDISQIPHPFTIESMALFKGLTKEEKSKIHFIHFNHTNPILNPQSPQSKEVISKGFKIARINDIFKL